MAAQIFVLDKVSEDSLLDIIKEAGDDGADIVTAINDGKGTFTIESTFVAAGVGGATLDGKMSTFGGPDDHGVGRAEGLALYDQNDVAANPDLFGPQPPGTTGLARRLNPQAKYIACRWDYLVTPKSFLRSALVKVTNPKNNASLTARPVDWGPNVDTGRVADLSPGLASALGLNDTGLECKVEIPAAPGAPAPVQGTGVATGVNLAQIDGTIFGQGMSRKLIAVTTSNQATFWIINLTGDNEGGQSLLRHVGDKTEVVLSDTTVFPVQASDKIPPAIAAELNKAAPDITQPDQPVGNPPQPGDDINAKLFASAKAFVNHDTSNAPGTEGGALACAWAVNQVTRLALGKPISALSNSNPSNGISTAQMFDVLKAHHTEVGSAADAKPGVIIIAPSTPNVHGHVGIVGQTAGSVNETDVFSNKSHPGVFLRNFTIGSFTAHYTGMGLRVHFFALNRNQF